MRTADVVALGEEDQRPRTLGIVVSHQAARGQPELAWIPCQILDGDHHTGTEVRARWTRGTGVLHH